MKNTLKNLLSQNRGVESQKKGRGKKVTESTPGQILQFDAEGTAATTTDFQVAAGDQTSLKAGPSGYNKMKGGKRSIHGKESPIMKIHVSHVNRYKTAMIIIITNFDSIFLNERIMLLIKKTN